MTVKRIITLFSPIILSINLIAQAPQAFQYQAIARDANGQAITNQQVSFRFSLLSGHVNGTPVYEETHQAQSNSIGLVNLVVGQGQVQSGSMATVNWATGLWFLKTELDPNGGNNYQLSGTTQLLSVPYALYAENSGTPGPQGPPGPAGTTGQSITEVYGTGQLAVSSSTTTYTLIPGLSTNVNIPANAHVIVSTDGGIQCTGTGNAYSIVDLAIFVDGNISTQAGQRRIVAANTTGLAQVITNWSFSKSYTGLSAGNHTFEVKAVYPSGTGAATANVSSSSAPQMQGRLSITVINP